MSIFDPAKIALNKSIVDAMPEWKKGERMNEKKLTEVERLRAINAQLLEALEMLAKAEADYSLDPADGGYSSYVERVWAQAWNKAGAAIAAAKEGK